MLSKTDLVNLDQLVRREQSRRNHSAFDQRGAFVAHRRNQVAPAKPGTPPERAEPGARGLFDLVARQRRESAGVEVQFARNRRLA
ncbi:MAG: hypothetical protein E6L09_02295 [Verrucomicrobia bacterium]|nr:MAG: hypothetical protein E6L09_02295 [Verrucomicrobiota bacterium]